MPTLASLVDGTVSGWVLGGLLAMLGVSGWGILSW